MKQRPALLSAIGFTFVLLAILGISLTAQAAPTAATPQAPTASAIRVSQAYGGGGATTGSPAYRYDYVELFNSSAASVDISGWSLQYGSATGNFPATNGLYTFTAGTTIAPGKYLLVQVGSAGTVGPNLAVTPDFTTTNLSMSASSGKVVLANISTGLGCGGIATPCTLPDSRIVDLVAWGNVTSTVEITAVNYPNALNSTQGAVRNGNGCQDTDNNYLDFTVVASPTLVPRNSASPANSCTVSPQADLAVLKSGPATANAGDAITYTISLSNTGTATATLSVLTDTLPAEVSFVTYTTAAPVTFTHPSATQLVWQLGDVLTTTPEISIQVQGVITTNVTNGTVVTNTAVATTASPESNLGNNISQVTTTVSSSIVPDVEIYVQKSGPAVVFGGELISYTIVYGNNGTQSVTATLTDTLPISFTVADIAFNDGPPNPIDNTNTRSWTATLASGDRFTFTLALTVPTAIANNTLITNTIAITATGAGNNPNNDLSAASSIVYQIVPISDARAGSNGQIFAIEGQVIVVPNTYSASEWELQDSSGAIAMFYSSPPAVSLGDHIRVVAPRSTFSGQQQLGTPLYFQNLGPGTHVTPRPFQTGQIAAGTAQGWLAVISGTLSNLTTCTGNYDLFVNDGSGAADVFINSFSGSVINPCAQGFTNGDWVSVTGFSTIFSSTTRLVYEVRPRSMSDLVRYPRVLNVSPANNATGVAVAAPITAAFNLTMTNVGAATFLLENAAGAVAGAVSYDTATRVATFTPTAALAFNTRYTATLKSTLQASNGLTLMPAQDYVWTFITYQPQPNLSIAKTVATVSDPVELGAVVTYTFTLSNTGDGAATSVLITDVLPSAVNFGGFVQQNSATYSSGTITWSGSLNAGAAATVIFTATVKNDKTLYGTDVMNTVQFTSGNGGSGSANIAFAIVKHYFIYLPLIQR